MKVIAIVAVAKHNNGIGKNNDLLWHLPADMQFFKNTTAGYPVITGRKNYESIPLKFRPLPNRENIIVTRQKAEHEGAFVVHSLQEAIDCASNFKKEKAFIIGGGQIYQQALDANLVDELLITWVDAEPEADVFFPEIGSEWVCTEEALFKADAKNKYDYSFCKYTKA